MNCGRVSNLLSAYIDRELTGAEMLHLRGHLSDCDGCRAEYEALHLTKIMLGNLRAVEPGEEFLAMARHRIEASDVRLPGVQRWASGGLERCLAGFPYAILPTGGQRGAWLRREPLFSTRSGRGILRVSVPGFLRLVPWPRITIGFTTAALVAALVSASVVLRKPRHSDALVATSPIQIIQGLDPQSSQPFSGWGASDFAVRSPDPGRLPGSPVPLHWTIVSLQGDSSRGFR